MFDKQKFPKGALQIVQKLQENSFKSYLVGGCMRDLLLKKTPHEWDLTTDATPQDVAKLFDRVIPTGIEFGTVTVLLDDGTYEVTTFRSEERYKDGRHPAKVSFTKDVHDDLSRRDFTVNALAYDPLKSELIDDFAGRSDLKKKLIKCVGDPLKRFSEDGLRSVRACRFAAQLNFEIDKKTFAAIPKTLKVTKKVAPERLHDEIVKMLKNSDKPSAGFEYMRRSKLLDLIMPELTKTYKVKQPPQYHQHDVYWHSLYAMDAAPRDNLVVRLAALLHDISKPVCKKGYTFYDHDQKGAKTTEKILRRLRFSNEIIKKVCNLVKNHMFDYKKEWSDAAVRRFITRVGLADVSDLFLLRKADSKAMKSKVDYAYLTQLQKRINKIIEEQNALHIKDLKINGKDVMRELNIPSGPKVGQVLKALLEKVLDDPNLNDYEKLLAQIRDKI